MSYAALASRNEARKKHNTSNEQKRTQPSGMSSQNSRSWQTSSSPPKALR